ncbi:HAD family hydrolase [Streptomyces sp. 184]|uniref:HAD family hydrolase n=1 Tax=Streptomyces sp. 184 TaxID=1827526 RepID=UPI003892A304
MTRADNGRFAVPANRSDHEDRGPDPARAGLGGRPGPAARPGSARPDPLAGARCVLLDFDGPLCRFFAGPPGGPDSLAPGIADDLRALLGGLPELRARLAPLPDPHEVYRRTAAALRRDGQPEHPVVAAMRKRLDERELAAAGATAVPTPGAAGLLARLADRGVLLGVASNNSEAAIRVFLERAGMARWFEDGPVVGRPDDAGLMKPHPAVLRSALAYWPVRPDTCVLVGDSPADAAAAAAAGVAFCGYHREPAKRRRLRELPGAPPAVAELAELAPAGRVAVT